MAKGMIDFVDGAKASKKNVNKNNKHSEKFVKNFVSSSDLVDLDEDDLDEYWK